MHENQSIDGAIVGESQVLVTPPFVAGEVPQTITLPNRITVSATASRPVVGLSAE